MPDLITTSNRERGTADRLYDLLDTLIAARATFELADDGREGAAALGQKRGAEVRTMLDEAITPRNASSEASSDLPSERTILARHARDSLDVSPERAAQWM